MSFNLFPGQFSPIPDSFTSIAVANGAAVGLGTIPTGPKGLPKYALVQAIGGAVNWRDDGVAPTAAQGGGMYLAAAAAPVGFTGDLSAIEFISQAVGGSTLLISYYY